MGQRRRSNWSARWAGWEAEYVAQTAPITYTIHVHDEGGYCKAWSILDLSMSSNWPESSWAVCCAACRAVSRTTLSTLADGPLEPSVSLSVDCAEIRESFNNCDCFFSFGTCE